MWVRVKGSIKLQADSPSPSKIYQYNYDYPVYRSPSYNVNRL